MLRTTGVCLLVAGLLTGGVGFMLLSTDRHMGAGALCILVAVFLIVPGLAFTIGISRDTSPKPIDGRVGRYLADVHETRTTGDLNYGVHYRLPIRSGRKQRRASLTVELPVQAPTTLQCDDENWFDRLSKRIFIAREHETGDATFDAAMYVRCPSEDYAEAFLSSQRKRAAILSLRKLGFQCVRLTGTQVEAVWTGFNPEKHDQADLTAKAARRLAALTEALPHKEIDFMDLGDRRLIRYRVLWGLCIAFSAIWLFKDMYTPLRDREFTNLTLLTLLIVFPIFAWLAAFLLRGTSTSHDRWVRFAGFGVLLIGFGLSGTLAVVNGYDTSEPFEERTYTVMDKSEERSRRSKKYYLVVWEPDRPGHSLSFGVSRADYERAVPKQTKIHLTIGHGRLGFEWVKDFRFSEQVQ